MDSGQYDSRNDDERTQHFRLCLSQHLDLPIYGNVKFFQSENPEGPKLFAFSHVWEYPTFKSCGNSPVDESD
jgi:hypothetical protein